jgi:HD-like signal output (HDOD) protein
VHRVARFAVIITLMAGHLMLVIVVVAAGMLAAALVLFRSRPTPDRPDEGSSTDLRRTAPAQSDNSDGDAQPHRPPTNPAADLAQTATPPAPTPRPAPTPPTSAAQPKPAAQADDSDLEFSLEIPTKPAANTPGADTSGSAPPNVTPVTPAAPAVQALHPANTFAKLFELALGKSRPAPQLNPGHAELAAAVSALIDDAATQDRYVPRRPNMLPKVLSASNDDSFSRRELAALIAHDPSLVGNLLKIANSSYYRVTPQPIESVDRAVVLLGTDGIRSLVTAALMQPIFRIGGADFPRFPDIAWEHTYRSASAAVAHNFLLEKSDPFAAELLCLVMGLAEIVIFRVTMDQYAKHTRLRPDAAVVASLLDEHAASIARRIGTTWELSEPTLTGLDGQGSANTTHPTALGRSVYFGRVVGALAVLSLNRVIDEETGKASIPATDMPEQQVERMWSRLT